MGRGGGCGEELEGVGVVGGHCDGGWGLCAVCCICVFLCAGCSIVKLWTDNRI